MVVSRRVPRKRSVAASSASVNSVSVGGGPGHTSPITPTETAAVAAAALRAGEALSGPTVSQLIGRSLPLDRNCRFCYEADDKKLLEYPCGFDVLRQAAYK